MSLTLNLSNPTLKAPYLSVLSGSSTLDWVLYTYAFGNDIKLQSSGSGGLEELCDEFYDGRVQWGFARVIDTAGNGLPKFVLINWCGEGVPESKKGLFASHSAVMGEFLRGAHVVVQARNEVGVLCLWTLMIGMFVC